MYEHGASNFGRDHGLLHEVVVTGRKIGAGRQFWGELAENEDLLGKFLGVTQGFYREPEPIKVKLRPIKPGMELPILGTAWTQHDSFKSQVPELTEVILMDVVLQSADRQIPATQRFDSQSERISCLRKTGHRLLDARFLLALLAEPECIPIVWWYGLHRQQERFPRDAASCRTIRFDGESFLDCREPDNPKLVTFGLEPEGVPGFDKKIVWKPVVHELHDRYAHHELSAVLPPLG